MPSHDQRRRPSRDRDPFATTRERKPIRQRAQEEELAKLVDTFAGKGALKDVMAVVSHYVDEDATVGVTHRGQLREGGAGYVQTGEQRTTGATFSPWQKKVGVSTTKVEDERVFGDDEGSGTTRSTSYAAEASLKGGKASRTRTTTEKDGEKAVEKEREDTVDVDFDDGVAAGYERSNKTTVEDGDAKKQVTGSSWGGKVAVSGDGVAGTGSWSRTSTDAAGTQTTQGRSVGVGFGEGGPSINAGMTKKVTDDEGKKQSSGVAVHAGPESVGIDLSSSKDGLSTSLGVELGHKTKAGVEKLGDGRFAVDYGEASSAGVSAGAAGAKIGVSNSHGGGGRRLFATRAEAESFAVMVKLGHRPDAPATAEEAMALQPGEEVSSTGTRGASLGGKLGGPILSVGGSASHSANRSLRVARVDENTVEVERAAGDSDQLSMSMGNKLGGFDKGRESHAGHHEKLRFDVSSPEGKAALERYLAGGQAPLGGRPGVKLLDVSETTGSGENAHVNLGPIKFGMSEGTDHTYGLDEKGDYTEDKGHHASSLTIPLWGHLSDSTVLTERTQAGHTEYGLKSTVSGSDGDDINIELARATGTYKDGSNRRSGSGNWEVETRFDEDEMGAIVARLRHGGGLVGSLKGVGALDALRAATTKDEQLRALAKMASKQGLHMLQTLRGNMNGGEVPDDGSVITDTYVRLEGDKNFIGAGGHDKVRGQLAAIEKQEDANRDKPDADPRAALLGVGVLEAQLRERRAAIANPQKYTDLPETLRELELKRLDDHLGRIDETRERMIEGQAMFDREERAARTGGELEPDARDVALGDQNELRSSARSLESLAGAHLDLARQGDIGEELNAEDGALATAKAAHRLGLDMDDPKRSPALVMYRKAAESHDKAQKMRAAADRLRAAQAPLLRVNPVAATAMMTSIKTLLEQAVSLEAVALVNAQSSERLRAR